MFVCLWFNRDKLYTLKYLLSSPINLMTVLKGAKIYSKQTMLQLILKIFERNIKACARTSEVKRKSA